jgi:hypothetical protein
MRLSLPLAFLLPFQLLHLVAPHPGTLPPPTAAALRAINAAPGGASALQRRGYGQDVCELIEDWCYNVSVPPPLPSSSLLPSPPAHRALVFAFGGVVVWRWLWLGGELVVVVGVRRDATRRDGMGYFRYLPYPAIGTDEARK